MRHTKENDMNTKTKRSVLFSSKFIILLILFVGLFVAFCTGVAKAVRCSVQTTGVIVGHEQSYHGSAKYYPVIQYTADGQTYKQKSDSSSNIRLGTGNQIKVKYNPNNPSEFTIGMDYWLFPLAIIIMIGSVIAMLALLGIIRPKRR